MIQNMTYFMKKIGFYLMVKDTPISLPEHPRFGQLLRTLMVGLMMLSGSVAWGQHATGVDGTTVYLNDLESHSWSYYSDPSCPIRSLHPVDVEIHYLGNGIVIPDNSTPTSISDNDASNWRISSGAAVSYNESQDEFVYYKTLERSDGATATTVAGATGRCEYTTIPNPFSKRPVNAPTSRTMYLNWSRNNTNNSGTITVNYTNESGSSQTFTQNINGTGNTTLTMKVGTTFTYTVTCTASRTSRYNTFSVRYDGSSGTQIVNEYVYGTNNTASGTSESISAPLPGDSDWRGFYKWRIKTLEHGTIHSASTGGTSYAQGAIVDAEQKLHFQPESGYEESGMKVEFEAVWARAYVTTGSTSMNTYASGTNAYERNFHVVTSTGQTASNYQKSYPVTISSRYPDGSDGGGSFNAGNFTAAANTKVEYLRIGTSNNYAWTANNHSFVVGRGVTGTVNVFRGINGNVTSPNYTLRIESGTYNYVSMLRGYSNTSGTSTDGNNNTLGGTPSIRAIIGCDYDRATNNGVTNNLIIANNLYYASGVSEANGIVYSENAVNAYIKSGKISNSVSIANNHTAAAQYTIYMGGAANRLRGHRKLFLEGGEVASIAGGIDASANQNNNSLTFRMTGGHVRGVVYGGGARSAGYGNRKFIITGGDIIGWVGGGCNGEAYPSGQTSEDTYGGITYGASKVYFGGNAICGGTGSNLIINGSVGGTVFGAGKGVEGNTTSGRMSQGTTVVVADECDIERNVYGGGNFGYAQTSTDVYITGGTVHGSVFGGSNQNNGPGITITAKGNGTVEGGLYGGSNASGNVSSVTMNIGGSTFKGGVYGGGFGTNTVSCDVSGAVNITMTGGTVLTGLYGGGNVRSVITGTTTVNVNGGTIGASGTPAGVYGGGLGQNTRANNSVTVNIGAQNATTGATIYGDVYGGSAKGSTNYTGSAANGSTAVTLNAGTIYGSLYGGAHGLDAVEANVYGAVTVTVNGGKVKPQSWNTNNPASIFGCNNAAGSPKSTVSVTINKTDDTTLDGEGKKIYAINGVYGGGNEAHYDYDNANYPIVTINGCESTSIKDVYGGGNAAAVPSTHVTINGGDIYRVFGGGNGESEVPAHVGYKNKTENSTTSAYTANGNVSLSIKGGTINQVFGGSNAHGTIKGTINVEVEKNSSCPIQVHELYGGGNQAASNVGNISIKCMAEEDMIDYVYGGSNDADITGNINLSMTGGRIGNLFGGNNTGHSVNGSITVTVNWITTGNTACSNNYLGSVFGGGNLAQYSSPNDDQGKPTYPRVNILNGTVSGNVYGGGAGELVDGAQRGVKGKVTGNPIVTIGDDVSGHTAIVEGEVYGGGDAADVAGTPVIVVNDCNTEIGYLYGGGNAADVDGTNITINGGTILHDAFGGGHGDKDASNPSKYADVKGNVVFNVYGGTIGRVFAGSNSKGNITGTSALTINKTGNCAMKIGQVYGGGNEAAGKASSVNIGCTGTLVSPLTGSDRYGYEQEGINMVFGGANQADIGTAQNPSNIEVNINSGIVANVFGGNNTSGDIHGTITVNIEKTNESNTCGWYVGTVCGGGMLARYAAPTDG